MYDTEHSKNSVFFLLPFAEMGVAYRPFAILVYLLECCFILEAGVLFPMNIIHGAKNGALVRVH